MKTKVCPCCDQPITGIYCKGCRKIVLKPAEHEIRYYLNTRHPQDDHSCSFHNDINAGNTYRSPGTSEVRQSGHKMTMSESERKKAEIRARMENRRTEQKQGKNKTLGLNPSLMKELKRHESFSVSDSQRKSLMTGLIVGVIFFMMIFGSIMAEIIGIVM